MATYAPRTARYPLCIFPMHFVDALKPRQKPGDRVLLRFENSTVLFEITDRKYSIMPTDEGACIGWKYDGWITKLEKEEHAYRRLGPRERTTPTSEYIAPIDRRIIPMRTKEDWKPLDARVD